MALPVSRSGKDAQKVQVALLKAAGPAARVAAARAMSGIVIYLSRRAIRDRHPQWSARQISLEFLALHYGRDLADRVRHTLERREVARERKT